MSTLYKNGICKYLKDYQIYEYRFLFLVFIELGFLSLS
jgi:hypothetical protein